MYMRKEITHGDPEAHEYRCDCYNEPDLDLLQLHRLFMKTRILTLTGSARSRPMGLAAFALKPQNRQEEPAVLYTIVLCREKESLSIRVWTYLMSVYTLEHCGEQQDVMQWGRTEEH
jgi:hypothetical protein